ncbi:MAG: alanine dehydrogenase [Methanothrix sp.]|uniref:alanine dehydrogenase n=1 Tax=Methanothrix sp. TaxID=90426 RepID=UPI002600B4C9|nr:alanine dehydrogenase [Methanothrix sp.]MCQ8903451.1 alanine dehydrogenase [Methanothrix sp.]
MELLWLSEDDVRSLLTMEEAIPAVESAFAEHGLGNVQMPPKSYLYYDHGDLRTMPAYIKKLGATGVKIVNSHPTNPQRGMPSVMAIVVLNSVETGAPLAVMGGTYLTAVRTGAAGGIAAKYLARPDSSVVGIVGAGAQARTQIMALAKLFGLELVKVLDKSPERAGAFVSDVRGHLNCDCVIVSDVKEACDCDILVTATPSRSPVVLSDWIKSGTHINAIGADAPGKQELEPSLLRRAKVVVDDISQAIHSGEVNVPISRGEYRREDIHAQLGEIVAGMLPGRESEKEITIFDSTGLAIQDIAVGSLVYTKARALGMGTVLEFL